MSRSVSHQVVVVTGAARGIGAQVARDLVGAGARVAVLDRDVLGAQRLVAELGSATAAFEVDVTSVESVHSACAAVAAHFGTIDVVVANAGPLGTLAPVEVAAAAITTVIARRSRRVCAPWWVTPMLDLRPLLFLADRLLAVLPSTRRAISAGNRRG